MRGIFKLIKIIWYTLHESNFRNLKNVGTKIADLKIGGSKSKNYYNRWTKVIDLEFGD